MVKTKLKEITITSSLSPPGSDTQSSVSFKFDVDYTTNHRSVRKFLLEQKWNLDHILLEMENARGGLSDVEFDKMRGQLENRYVDLLED